MEDVKESEDAEDSDDTTDNAVSLFGILGFVGILGNIIFWLLQAFFHTNMLGQLDKYSFYDYPSRVMHSLRFIRCFYCFRKLAERA